MKTPEIGDLPSKDCKRHGVVIMVFNPNDGDFDYGSVVESHRIAERTTLEPGFRF